MGNHTTSEVLKEEDEPNLNMEEHNFQIRSVLTDNHSDKKSVKQPVLVFDKWKILNSDIPDIRNEKLADADHASETTRSSLSPSANDTDDVTSSSEELSSYCKANETQRRVNKTEEVQKTHSSSVSDSKSPIVRKPRPNSLAITSLSLDLTSIPSSSSTSDKEVCSSAASGPSLNVSSTNINFQPRVGRLAVESRSASADALIETRPGLQQRRKRGSRPTSLQIPSILHIPPPPVRTAHQFSYSQDFSFTR